MVLFREGNGTPLQYSCLENPMDRGAWWAAVHGVARSRTRLSDFTFTFHLYALEKEMATHSSVLAWRIPGTGEPGGLPSLGSHRVRHDWSNLAAAAAWCFSDFPGGSVIKNPPANAADREMWVRSLGKKIPWRRGIATHSSILAWRIPWTEEPGMLQSIGSQRVGRYRSTLACAHPFFPGSPSELEEVQRMSWLCLWLWRALLWDCGAHSPTPHSLWAEASDHKLQICAA